ncbi:hypothetical protein PSTT_05054, partial [Puccinia striiformis]
KLLVAEFGEISEETGYGEVVRIVCVKVIKSLIGCREELEEQGVGPFLKGHQPGRGPKLATTVRLEMAFGRSPPHPYIPKVFHPRKCTEAEDQQNLSKIHFVL